jgi:hypothetical protein
VRFSAKYGLTEWGQELCPALDALLTWAEARQTIRRHFGFQGQGGRSPPRPRLAEAYAAPNPERFDPATRRHALAQMGFLTGNELAGKLAPPTSARLSEQLGTVSPLIGTMATRLQFSITT